MNHISSAWRLAAALITTLAAGSAQAQSQSDAAAFRSDVTSGAFVSRIIDASDVGRREKRQQVEPNAVLESTLKYFQRDCAQAKHRTSAEVRACSGLAALGHYLLTGEDHSLVGNDDAALKSAQDTVARLRAKIQGYEQSVGETFAIPRGAIKSTGIVTNNLRNTLAHGLGDELGSSLQAAGASSPVTFHTSYRDDEPSTWSIDAALYPETAVGDEAPELIVERLDDDSDGGGSHGDFGMSGGDATRAPMIAGDFAMSGAQMALMSGMDMGMGGGFSDFSDFGDAPSRGIRATFALIPGLAFNPSAGTDTVDLPIGGVSDAASDCVPSAQCNCASGGFEAAAWRKACREVGTGAALTTTGRMPRQVGADPGKVAAVIQTIVKQHDAEMAEVARRRWKHPAFQPSEFAVLGAVPNDAFMREQMLTGFALGETDGIALTLPMPGMSGMPGMPTAPTTSPTAPKTSPTMMPSPTIAAPAPTTAPTSFPTMMPGTTTTTTTGGTTTTAQPNILIGGKRWTCSGFSLDGGATCSPAGGSGGGNAGDAACKVAGANAGLNAPQGAKGDAAAANNNNCAANGAGGGGGYGACPTAQGSVGVSPTVDSCPKTTVSRPWNGGRCNHIGTQLRSWSGPIGPGDSYGDTRWEECTEYMLTQDATGTCGNGAKAGSIWRICYYKKRKGDLGFEYERDGRGNLVYYWGPVGANSAPPPRGGAGATGADRIATNIKQYLDEMEKAREDAKRAAASCKGKIQVQDEVAENAQQAYDDLKKSVEDAGRKLIVDIINEELKLFFGDIPGQVLGSMIEILTNTNADGLKDGLKGVFVTAVEAVLKKKGVPDVQAAAIANAIGGFFVEGLNDIIMGQLTDPNKTDEEKKGILNSLMGGLTSGIGGAIQDTVNELARQACKLAGTATSGSEHLGAALGSVCALLADIAQKEAKALFWNLRLIGCASDVRQCLNTVLFYQRRAANASSRLSALKCAMKAIAEMGPQYQIDFNKIFNEQQQRR